MRHFQPLLLVFAGVVVGCVVKDVYFTRADAAPPRVHWEYRCLSDGETTTLAELVEGLNKAGQEGWELASTGNRTSTTSHYCLKRSF